MPEPETPVDARVAVGARSASWIESAKQRVGTPRHFKRVIALGPPADLPRALLHPAVMSGRFAIVESIAIEVDDGDIALDAFADAAQLVRAGRANTFLVAGDIGPAMMRRVADVALAFHCEVLAVMPTEVLPEHDPVVVWKGDSALIQLARLPRHPIHNLLKRLIDIIGATIGLIVTAPLLVVLAPWVMIESPGNPIFKHTRIGFRGRKFKCLKLRTMRTDAESILRSDARMYEEYRQNHFKIPEERDPRVTRVGRFLRQTSIDELPQLWNVLVGEMSLVGPRPVVEEELAVYGEDKDLMLSVKPGLTGAWAVSGRQSVGYPERCELELGYVRDRTLWRDLEIVLRTTAVVLRLPFSAE